MKVVIDTNILIADNKFVDCATSANAICLVSEDNHFKILKKIDFPKVNLLSLKDFEKAYRSALERKQI